MDLNWRRLRKRLLPDVDWAAQIFDGMHRRPAPASRSETVQTVLAVPEMQEVMERVAREQALPREQVEARARRLVWELAAEPYDSVIRSFGLIFRRLLRQMFSGLHVNAESLAKLRKLHEHAPLVVIPNHTSHLDYLTIAYLLIAYKLEPPYIAAGENMNFLGMGWVFRHSGAFFIRRAFGNDKLYKAVVSTYMSTVLRGGHNIKFFIEGSRSRTGKLLHPKLGLLGDIVNGALANEFPDCYICPASVQYEKVLEGETFSNELLGASKQQESLSGLLNASGVVRLNFGHIHVRFAEPFRLREFINTFTVDRGVRPVENAEDRRKLVAALGYRVVHDINTVKVVMPSAVVASLILSHPGRGLNLEDLVRKFDVVCNEASRRGATVPTFEDTVGVVVDRTLHHLSGLLVRDSRRRGWIEPMADAPAALQLSFYRNQLIHLFASEAIVAVCARSRRSNVQNPLPMETLVEDARFLSQLLKFEFIFPPHVTFADTVRNTVEDLRTRGILDTDSSNVWLTDQGRNSWHVMYLCGLLWPFVEAYWSGHITLLTLLPRRLVTQGLLLEQMRLVADTLYFENVVSYLECQSLEVLRNVLKAIQSAGLLSNQAVLSSSKGERLMQLTPEYRSEEALMAMADRIGSFRRPHDLAAECDLLDRNRLITLVESGWRGVSAKM